MSIYVAIEKQLGEFHLQVNLESDSRRIGVLGASGCGKSMTLKCIAGIETPDRGTILVDGKQLYDSNQKIHLKPQKRNIGYLFQNYALFPTMTVEQNIAAGLKGTKKENRERVLQMMEKFQIRQLAHRLPGELSGGQQQRVALARIMAYEPDVILLDEPFSALDSFLKNRLQQEMKEMLEDYAGTVIMVSHNRDEIYRFSEELLIMDQGRAIEYGKTKTVFASPAKKESARLTGCKNFADLVIQSDHEAELPGWGIRIRTENPIPQGAKYLGYRAHDFEPVWGTCLEKENMLPVRVKDMAEMPFERHFYLEPAGEEEPICWFAQRDQIRLLDETGIPSYLRLKEESMLFLE